MEQSKGQTPQAFVKAAIQAEREQWGCAGTPVNTWNREFNAAAAHCGLSVEELLKLKDYFEVAGWGWQHLGDRIQCGNGRALWTVDRSALLAQVASEGIEVAELSGEQAAEAISELAGLELEPTARSEWDAALERAGFTHQASQRHALREEVKGGQR